MNPKVRYTVEGCKHYGSARAALSEACRMVYVSPEARARALRHLLDGRAVTLTYGFCSVEVTPPSASHAEIADERGTVMRASAARDVGTP